MNIKAKAIFPNQENCYECIVIGFYNVYAFVLNAEGEIKRVPVDYLKVDKKDADKLFKREV